MKKVFLAFAALLAFAACEEQKVTTPVAETTEVESKEVTFEVADNYFFNNDQQIPVSPKITSEEEFNKLFGVATTMGEEGNPTVIDFTKKFVLAIVLPVTSVETEIVPVKIVQQGDSLFYTYEVKTGEQQTHSIQPISIVMLDKELENKEVILINEQLMKKNMEEVQAYLKECGAFFIATTDSDQPRVRPFGVSEIIDGRLYIMTGKVKDVYKQMAANGKFEICALKPSGTEWMRISGTLVNDETWIIVEASNQTDLSYVADLGFEIFKEKKYRNNKHVFIRQKG